MAIGQYFDAQHQSHQIFKNHYLGGIPGVSLVEARGIPWGIPAGSCGSLLDDLIREEEKRMALL
jgi:hypothetical protein